MSTNECLMSSHSRAQKSVHSPVAVQANIIDQRGLPHATRPSEDFQLGGHLTRFQGPRGLYQTTVDKLPDDTLLEIFDFYLNDNDPQDVHKWHTLVHVCGRWRDIVFASPRRLNLRLFCDRDTPSRAMLDIWPALPMEIHDDWLLRLPMELPDLDNIIAALEHSDRVCSIHLRQFPSSAWKGLAAATQVQFPELTYLSLWSNGGSTPVLPDSFLGGSAPRLRTLKLPGIAFRALPNLLLSASDLVTLSFSRHLGYISPEAMVACLSSLNRLKSLSFGSQSPRSRPDQPSPPPQTRVVLPALTDLAFHGAAHYLDDFLARIDTPVLNKFSMALLLDDLFFDFPELMQFIDRAKGLKPYKVARVAFTPKSIQLSLTEPLPLSLEIMCDIIDLKVLAMSLACGQLSPFLSLVERLDLAADHRPSLSHEEYYMLSFRFLGLFEPFPAIRSLRVSESLISFIVPALQRLIGEGATEVLPNLRDLFMGRPTLLEIIQEEMQPFVDARRLSGQPIAIHHCKRSL
ncbi:hypothetical protein BC826DRAFT_966043 [Russula brevipes]|nr:hypothetical protein BC826DRAFT_966043 [Russula brevipes]